MAAAGAAALDSLRALASKGRNLVSEALSGADVFYEWRHYPEGDVYDPGSHGQYFYHAHPPGERAASEHGHFHAFLRPRGMPTGVQPLMLPELAIPDAPAQPQGPVLPPARQPNQGEENDKLSHLVAISMDDRGQPIRLFTTNRWVTGETWYGAQDVVRMLDRFAIGNSAPSAPLNRWLTAMFALFRPQMRALLVARDAAIMHWRRRHRGKVHVLEDRRLEVTSVVSIDLEDQIRQVEAALRRAA
jgi:uncharacterized protein DUF6969